MKWTRRRLLKVSGSMAVAQSLWSLGMVGCEFGKPLPRLLPSKAPLPQKYQVELPLLPVLRPSSHEDGADRYELTARGASASILPRLKTTIWGYNGIFPGPTIEARSGRKAIVTLHNDLPVPVVNHLNQISVIDVSRDVVRLFLRHLEESGNRTVATRN
jgi:spore coat protein A